MTTVANFKISAYHNRGKANRKASSPSLSKRLFKDLACSSRKNKNDARYEGNRGSQMVFRKYYFFPHLLQHLVTHLYIWKQTEQVSNSFFFQAFAWLWLLISRWKGWCVGLVRPAGYVARLCVMLAYIWYEQGRLLIFSGQTPVADKEALISLLQDATVIE